MSNKNCRDNIFQNKTFNHRNPNQNIHKNSILSGAINIIYQKIKKNINPQCNQIEFEFNNHCKYNKYINKTLIRSMKSMDFLDIKRNITKESEGSSCYNDNKIIKHNFSLKVVKPKLYNKYNNKIKNVDIDLNIKKIKQNDYLSILKYNNIKKKRNSHSTSIKREKTKLNRIKNMKNRLDNFDLKESNLKDNKYNINKKQNSKILKTTRNTSPTSPIREENLSFKKAKKINERINTKNNCKINLNLKPNKGKYKVTKIIDKRKLSFDFMENNFEKNKSLEAKLKNNYTNIGKNNLLMNKKKDKNKNIKKSRERLSYEDISNYNILTENEQGMNNKINEIKINNFVINKPKEENMKFSSLKYNFNENDDQTDKISEISKIIIGQIEGYKDIMDQDKSKSLMEILSKISFAYTKNSNNFKQSNINDDNTSSHFFDEINNDLKEINNINITKIKNIDEDYDSVDLSNIIRNNIKSINTNSNKYIYKNKISLKNRNNIKTSMNTNNTTISSKEKNSNKNENNIKANNNQKETKNKSINPDNFKQFSPYTIKRVRKIEISNDNENKEKNKNELIKNNYKIINKNKIRKKLDITKRLTTIKSTTSISKKLDTNLIFNSPKKFKKKIDSKITNGLNNQTNKSPPKNENEKIKNKENEMNKIIDNNSMITTIMNGDNETIINSCFNDAENEICNNKEYNTKNKNAFNQCILF